MFDNTLYGGDRPFVLVCPSSLAQHHLNAAISGWRAAAGEGLRSEKCNSGL